MSAILAKNAAVFIDECFLLAFGTGLFDFCSFFDVFFQGADYAVFPSHYIIIVKTKFRN
jgi:hypothetical protein